MPYWFLAGWRSILDRFLSFFGNIHLFNTFLYLQPADTVSAWSSLVTMIFSSVRDGYYSELRRHRMSSRRTLKHQSTVDSREDNNEVGRSRANRRNASKHERTKIGLDEGELIGEPLMDERTSAISVILPFPIHPSSSHFSYFWFFQQPSIDPNGIATTAAGMLGQRDHSKSTPVQMGDDGPRNILAQRRETIRSISTYSTESHSGRRNGSGELQSYSNPGTEGFFRCAFDFLHG